MHPIRKFYSSLDLLKRNEFNVRKSIPDRSLLFLDRVDGIGENI